MINLISLKEFNKIYDLTYQDVLKFIICKCYNINDVNDIIQETYFELWRILNKRNLINNNIKNFIIGIANNRIKKHYRFKIKTISLFSKDDNDIELIDKIKNNVDIESIIINDDNWNKIWEYLKKMKNQNIPKIFYLYYNLDLTIKEISNELNLNESYIKNSIYRTLKKLYSTFKKECDSDE